MSSGQEAIIQRFIDEVMNQGKLEVADEIIAPDVINHSTVPGLPEGREGAKRTFELLRRAFPDIQFQAEDIMVQGEKAVIRWSGRGTHTGTFVFLDPTGKPVTVAGMDMVRIQNGKIVERWGYYDQVGVMRQLGLIPDVRPELGETPPSS